MVNNGATSNATLVAISIIAEILGREALHLHQQELDSTNPEIALSLNTLANVYESQGRYAVALDHYEQALSIDEAYYGNDHPAVASSLSDIGGILSG